MNTEPIQFCIGDVVALKSDLTESQLASIQSMDAFEQLAAASKLADLMTIEAIEEESGTCCCVWTNSRSGNRERKNFDHRTLKKIA